MVLKAGFFLGVGTAFGMYLAQEYQGMPNVKAFTVGLVSMPSGRLLALGACHFGGLKFHLQLAVLPSKDPGEGSSERQRKRRPLDIPAVVQLRHILSAC